MTVLKDGKHMLKLKNNSLSMIKLMSSVQSTLYSTIIISAVASAFVLVYPAETNASQQAMHPVSPLAREIGTFRVDNVLFRYIRFTSESDHPCLRLETFEPASLTHVARREICGIQVAGLQLDLRKDVAFSSFENFRLERNTFSFSVDLSVKRADSIYANCTVKISAKGAISEPFCVQGRPDPASSGGK